jgi:hypothetical protein
MDADRTENCDTARIERGWIAEASNGFYRVASYGRSGLVTPWIVPLDPEAEYTAGDKVYFFLFDDGTGRILGSFT